MAKKLNFIPPHSLLRRG